MAENNYVTKEACRIHKEQIIKDYEALGKEVEKLKDVTNDLRLSDGKQMETLEHIGKAIDTLNNLMGKLSNKLADVDKTSSVAAAVTQQAVKFNIDLNWKTIGVMGTIILTGVNMFLK